VPCSSTAQNWNGRGKPVPAWQRRIRGYITRTFDWMEVDASGFERHGQQASNPRASHRQISQSLDWSTTYLISSPHRPHTSLSSATYLFNRPSERVYNEDGKHTDCCRSCPVRPAPCDCFSRCPGNWASLGVQKATSRRLWSSTAVHGNGVQCRTRSDPEQVRRCVIAYRMVL
jgi:hypothetical protein